MLPGLEVMVGMVLDGCSYPTELDRGLGKIMAGSGGHR